MKDQDVTVKRNEQEPEPLELVAAAILKVADGIDRMRGAGLSDRAIQVLLHDITGVAKRDIIAILNAGPKLRNIMLDWKKK